jgi:hypothetical protein
VSFVAELSPAGTLRPLPFRLLTLGQAITTSHNGSLVRGRRHTEAMAGLISSASVTGHDKLAFVRWAGPAFRLLSYEGSPASSAVRCTRLGFLHFTLVDLSRRNGCRARQQGSECRRRFGLTFVFVLMLAVFKTLT